MSPRATLWRIGICLKFQSSDREKKNPKKEIQVPEKVEKIREKKLGVPDQSSQSGKV